MVNPQEQGTVSTIESLIPQATQVYIGFVDGGWYGGGDWLEFKGKGKPELRELAERFGEKGIEAFNQAFVTPELEQSIEARAKNLTRDIIAADGDAGTNRIRNKWAAERERLEDFLRGIRDGKEASIRLGDKEIIQRGFQFGAFPVKDTILISLKKPVTSPIAS